jgi:hypothetical protein
VVFENVEKLLPRLTNGLESGYNHEFSAKTIKRYDYPKAHLQIAYALTCVRTDTTSYHDSRAIASIYLLGSQRSKGHSVMMEPDAYAESEHTFQLCNYLIF